MTDSKRRTYYDNGINWIWYLEVDLNPDNTVTIIKHYRIHKYEGDKHPVATLSYRLEETEDRTVTRVKIGAEEWRIVTNPKYIFDYK
jgi:hypothetical protein